MSADPNETSVGDRFQEPSLIAGWNLRQSYQRLPEVFYQSIKPKPVGGPRLAVLNQSLAGELGLQPNQEKPHQQQPGGVAEVLAGNVLPATSRPIAQAYAGHQFGHFTMLGDGRAILLGEQQTPSGRFVDVQLKGAGRTRFSRGGDGRAALGPMLREYLISEAMHGLGIPTTRSLAVVTTGESVFRDQPLPGAVLTRISQSHLRVGTFQFAAAIDDPTAISSLADYVIERHFPDLAGQPDRYLQLLKSVIDRQARLVARWMLVGFVHGVLNTDNVSICGETIDYGPCAFMDHYRVDTVFSSIDRQGRYAFGRQPAVLQWNLARFAETLLPLLGDLDRDPKNTPASAPENKPQQAVRIATEMVQGFETTYQNAWLAGMRRKLGLGDAHQDDLSLIQSLLDLMSRHQMDFTNTFDALTRGSLLVESPHQAELRAWHDRYQQRRQKDCLGDHDAAKLMRANNPAVIPRNHIVEQVLQAATQGDWEPWDAFLNVLGKPYNAEAVQQKFRSPASPDDPPYQTFCGT